MRSARCARLAPASCFAALHWLQAPFYRIAQGVAGVTGPVEIARRQATRCSSTWRNPGNDGNAVKTAFPTRFRHSLYVCSFMARSFDRSTRVCGATQKFVSHRLLTR